MCVDALWKASTNRSYACLFAAPYEIQIRAIFGRLSELISLSPELKRMVVSNTKTPFEIKFRNGSRILGLTSGAGTGNGAVNFRGQRADSIYIDESD